MRAAKTGPSKRSLNRQTMLVDTLRGVNLAGHGSRFGRMFGRAWINEQLEVRAVSVRQWDQRGRRRHCEPSRFSALHSRVSAADVSWAWCNVRLGGCECGWRGNCAERCRKNRSADAR